LSRTPRSRRTAVTVAAALFVLYPACLPAAVATSYDAFGLVPARSQLQSAPGTPTRTPPKTSLDRLLRPSLSLPSLDALASLDSILSDYRSRLATLVQRSKDRPDLDLSVALAAAQSDVDELSDRIQAARSALARLAAVRSQRDAAAQVAADSTARLGSADASLQAARQTQSDATARRDSAQEALTLATARLDDAVSTEAAARDVLSRRSAAVASARSALASAQSELDAAVSAVSAAEAAFNVEYARYSEMLARLDAARTARDVAQTAYDTLLIPDPTWTPETYEQARTRTVEVVSLVPRTITTLTGGLTADVFNRQGYNNAPPLPAPDEVPVYSTTVPTVDFNWGGGQVLGSGYSEDVVVRFTGSVSFPTSGYYQFYSPADDGTILLLDGVEVTRDWYDKGGGGSTSAPVYFEAGVAKTLTLYYYENGGGAAVWLYYYTPATNYVLVPAASLGTVVTTETVYEYVTTYVEETYYTTEVYPGQVHPLVSDPALLPALQAAQAAHDAIMNSYNDYANAVNEAGWAWQRAGAAVTAPSEAVAARTTDLQDSLTQEALAQTALEEATSATTDLGVAERQFAQTLAQEAAALVLASQGADSAQSARDLASQESLTADASLTAADSTLSEAETAATSAYEVARDTVVDLTPIEDQLATDPPEPEPEPEPEPGSPDLPTDLSADNLMEVDLSEVDPTELTEAQAEQLVVAALETFETATEGSAEYEQALDALFLAAQQDDLVVDETLASIPGVGQAAAAVVAIFNIVGNVGADISPEKREKAQTLVVTTLVVGQIAQTAALASASSGGSYRRK
jgi:hypothetical protein